MATVWLFRRYPDHYEKIHFLGEDPNEDRDESSDSRSKKIILPMYQVPLSYNHQQHEVTGSYSLGFFGGYQITVLYTVTKMKGIVAYFPL